MGKELAGVKPTKFVPEFDGTPSKWELNQTVEFSRLCEGKVSGWTYEPDGKYGRHTLKIIVFADGMAWAVPASELKTTKTIKQKGSTK